MKYVEFYDDRSRPKTKLGEIVLDRGKLVMSKDLAGRWRRSRSYSLLAKGGYETMYDPEKILESLKDEFTEPEFKASEVKERY